MIHNQMAVAINVFFFLLFLPNMTLSSFSTYRFLHLGELVSFLQKTSFYWDLVFTHEKGFSSPFSGGQSDLVYNDDKNHQVTTLTLYLYSQSPTCSLPVYNCSRAKPRLPSPSIYFWFALWQDDQKSLPDHLLLFIWAMSIQVVPIHKPLK